MEVDWGETEEEEEEEEEGEKEEEEEEDEEDEEVDYVAPPQAAKIAPPPDNVVVIDDDEDESGKEARSKLCEVCTYLNFSRATKCSMCRSEFGAASAGGAGSKPCPVCTFLNKMSSLACSMCRARFEPIGEETGNEGNKNSSSSSSDAGSSEKSSERACPVCTFINEMPATACSMCRAQLDPIDSVMIEGGDEETDLPAVKPPVSCVVCRVDNVDGYSLQGCGHELCRDCAVGLVGLRVEKLQSRFAGFDCPVCQLPLSRQDLRVVAGKDTVDYVDQWLCSRMRDASAAFNRGSNPEKRTKTAAAAAAAGFPWDAEMETMFATVEELRAVYHSSLSVKVAKKSYTKKSSSIRRGLKALGGSFKNKKSSKEVSAVVAVDKKVEDSDKVLIEVLRKLSDAIKAACLESGGRVSLPAAALLCSRDSIAREVLSWLLRNDSAMDIVSRAELHFELFALLRTVAGIPELLPLVCGSASDPSHDLWSGGEGGLFHPASLMGSFAKLHTQASFFLRSQMGVDDDENAAVEAALLGEAKDTFERLERRISAWRRCLAWHAAWMAESDQVFKLRHPDALPSPSSSSGASSTIEQLDNSTPPPPMPRDDERDHKGKQVVITADDPSSEELGYLTALKPLQFGQASLLQNHYFRDSIHWDADMGNGSRSRRIAKELAGLATQLPLEFHSSIHVRVDEFRMDLVRALIIGPHDTPYENGIFLFDIFLGDDYPSSPPNVQFLTTASGTVRFNPNLYHCGKVCLSLLGTWSGPSWQPGSSTLLQLLVSLQSLVFVGEPYYNEPRLEHCRPRNGGRSRESENYNYEQCFNTLMHSMAPALRCPDEAFKDLIAAHFGAKRRRIEEQCDKWSRMEWRRLECPGYRHRGPRLLGKGEEEEEEEKIIAWTTTSVNNGKVMADAASEVRKELAKLLG